MQGNDMISIIIPVYKVEKYLTKCVDSVLNQTYKNIEIILVDDGSPDNCPNICDEYEKKDKRIKVIHKKNGGLSDARNCGIENAKGKYLCFIDSDDYISPIFISTLYQDIRKMGSQISIVGFEVVEEWENLEDNEKVSKNTIEVFGKDEGIKKLFDGNSFGNYAWNKIYDRKMFENIKFPLGKKMEDLGIMYLLFEECEKISYNHQKLYYYVQRSGSILNSANKQLLVDKLELSIKRFWKLNEKYSNLIENKLFILDVCLEVYPVLNNELKLKEECHKIIKVVNSKSIRKKLSLKSKVKLFVYMRNKKVYSFIFGKYKNRKLIK